MIGGSDFLDDVILSFHKQPVFVFLGLTLTGLSAGLVSIPVLPEMLECVETNPAISNVFDLGGMESLISGLFIFFQSLGEATGPVISAYLTDSFGF
jgi:hypothetical protein